MSEKALSLNLRFARIMAAMWSLVEIASLIGSKLFLYRYYPAGLMQYLALEF